MTTLKEIATASVVPECYKEVFGAQGWSFDKLLAFTATKVYNPNQATMRLSYSKETDTFWVFGEYWSEGHNALALCTLSLPADVSAEMATTSLNALLKDAEYWIEQTFARKFLNRNKKETT